jgi:hypothetical protein
MTLTLWARDCDAAKWNFASEADVVAGVARVA